MTENLTYYPADMPIFIQDRHAKSIPNHEDIKLDWWSGEKSFFHYPKLLVSAFYGLEEPDFRKKIGFPDDGILIGDSGGYQLFSFKINQNKDLSNVINPESVLKWQEKNCDIGIILDFPIFKADKETFQMCLNVTSKNAKIAIEKRTRKDMLLYNVFQTYDLNKYYMDLWFNEMKQHDLDGWCISCKPAARPMFIALNAMYLLDKGYTKNFHILGASGSRTIPIMAWLSRYIENVTFDSSSYAEGGKRRTYFNPAMPLKKSIRFGRVSENTFERLPCLCPVCKTFKTVHMFKKEGMVPGTLISFHNLNMLIHHTQLLDRLKEDRETFKSYIKANFDREVMDAFEFIEYSIEHGFDKAFIKFQQRFKMYDGEPITGKLMDY